MATTPQPPPPPPSGPPWASPDTKRWGPGRVLALIFGLLFLLPAFGLLLAGGVLLWADGPARTDDGYLTSGRETFSTPGYAIASERIDLNTGADWMPVSAALGTVRVEVTGVDPGTPIFIGIAPAGDAAGYLAGVEHTVVRDFGAGASGSSEVLLPGGPPPGPPGEQDFWTSESSGPDTRELTWSPAEGNWTFVVMNADGSAGVGIDAAIGATVPALGGLGWGLLIAGLFCLLIAVVLLVLAFRSRSSGAGRPPAAYAPGTYAPGTYAPGTYAPGTYAPAPGPTGPPPAGAPPAWPSPAPEQRSAPPPPPPGAAPSPGGPEATGRGDVRRGP